MEMFLYSFCFVSEYQVLSNTKHLISDERRTQNGAKELAHIEIIGSPWKVSSHYSAELSFCGENFGGFSFSYLQ